MKWVILWVILLSIFGFIANAIVRAFSEAHGKPLPNKYHYPLVVITMIILFGLMSLLPKCSGEELTAPNGQTSTEHYEPRY